MAEIHRASTTAPVNIAVIKYWGKRDPKLNLPTNSSLSVTLSQSDLRTHTTASCSPAYPSSDTLLLNGSSQDVTGARTQACFRELRALRKSIEDADSSAPKLSSYPLKIVSENNFPTAAGLASSAAGFAALVRAIANLYELPASPTELSRIARQGSGSACRSLFGGYVGWEQGAAADGSDSVAFQVAPASHWPDMRALILVASAAKKDVSSTSGMQTTVATSSLFASRAAETVPRRMKEMQNAVQDKDFEAFGKVTMMDSNSFHATCLDTYPPIFYLNDTSRAAIKVVEAINTAAGKIIAAYTFDAGPNAVIYYLEENEKKVAGLFKAALGEKDGWAGQRGDAVEANGDALEKAKAEAGVALETLKDGVSRIILTGVGEGPIKTEESLIDDKGEPVSGS
ncbi:diphosphomevalonate decarboxylase [Melanomma pulvis-pyrius CBS 109.77]|uniref:Diphosphomevalonate decarboxylase n=1 Tax=Melanomma pulvis-pyrius CBS 109.77 TaxID=1314802 RepID=A0A6A6WW25_9PLEO|nr:diphosphomevalonate decarboxylase [Melanomma pulvis-pyrius CBS 109.77]